MTKKTATTIIILYLTYLIVPVIFKWDYFPMTWAPMYSAVKASDDYVLSVLDKESVRDKGFRAKHRDGTYSNITYKDLNVPFRSFWQIYSQRTYGIGPQVHRFAINEHGPDHVIKRDWNKQLFQTVNKTLGYDENHPKYVTELTVTKSFLFFTDTKNHPRLVKEIKDTLTVRVNRPGDEPWQSRPYLEHVVE